MVKHTYMLVARTVEGCVATLRMRIDIDFVCVSPSPLDGELDTLT